jgi:hypothetical protein
MVKPQISALHIAELTGSEVPVLRRTLLHAIGGVPFQLHTIQDGQLQLHLERSWDNCRALGRESESQLVVCTESSAFYWRVARDKMCPYVYDEEKGGALAIHIDGPTRIQAVGNKPKLIDEFIGRVNSGTASISIARMQSPSGWEEPGQIPEFDEYTVVLRGMLRVETRLGTLDVLAGQAVVTARGEWVCYSTPGPDGAEYVAVCLPAFSPETVHRDEA